MQNQKVGWIVPYRGRDKDRDKDKPLLASDEIEYAGWIYKLDRESFALACLDWERDTTKLTLDDDDDVTTLRESLARFGEEYHRDLRPHLGSNVTDHHHHHHHVVGPLLHKVKKLIVAHTHHPVNPAAAMRGITLDELGENNRLSGGVFDGVTTSEQARDILFGEEDPKDRYERERAQGTGSVWVGIEGLVYEVNGTYYTILPLLHL